MHDSEIFAGPFLGLDLDQMNQQQMETFLAETASTPAPEVEAVRRLIRSRLVGLRRAKMIWRNLRNPIGAGTRERDD